MSKRNRYFERIAEFKQRFNSLPTEKLRERISTGWSLQKEAAIAIRELLEEREGNHSQKYMIFVSILNEGVDVWRPVEAEIISDGIYRILSKNDDHDDETWQFQYGSVVRCEFKTFSGGESGLVAVELFDDIA